jgi:5,10-methenyltetrahydromethanopterin hydrogenase
MSFRIDVKGLTEAQDLINNLRVQPDNFVHWANVVQRTAKEICHDPECNRIKFKHTETLAFEYTFADKEAIDCVIKAINQHRDSMPMVLREIYGRVIIDLENKKKEFKST